MLHKLFIPIFRYNNKRVAILGNIRRKIKKQYHFMQESTDKFKNEELILRDYLAIERTKLANVRTLFSYIRTSLYLLTAGIGIFQIESISRLDGLAWVCVATGVILFFLGFIRYFQMGKQLKGYVKQSHCDLDTWLQCITSHEISPSLLLHHEAFKEIIPITISNCNLVRFDKYIIVIKRIDMGCIDYIRLIDP